MRRVTMTYVNRLRGAGIALLMLLAVTAGARPAAAAAPDATEAGETKSPASGAGDDTADKAAPAVPAAVPQAQIDDEGPSARVAKQVRRGPRTQVVAEDPDEKPFWKHWIFWSVTGALVAGAVGAVIYSTSGTRGAVGPCPADVALSLGCYGAGRK